MKTRNCIALVFTAAFMILLAPSAFSASNDYIRIEFPSSELHDDAVPADDYTSSQLSSNNDSTITYLGTDAVLRFDANGNRYLNDSQDYDLYNSIAIIDSAGGEIQLAYNLTEDTTYSNGDGNLDAGEVVTIRGTNYVITDNITSDQSIELGPAITRTLDAVAADPSQATTVFSSLKILYDTGGALFFYDGNTLVDLVSLNGITSYPYKLTPYYDITSDEYLPYNIYVVANDSTTAYVTFVEKSGVFQLENNEGGVMGYSSIKIGDSDWFAGGRSGVYLLSSEIDMVKGDTVDLEGTLYGLKYTSSKYFDLVRNKISNVANGTEIETTTAPGKDFLEHGPVKFTLGSNINIEFRSQYLHDYENESETFGALTLSGSQDNTILPINATAYLRYDGNADGDLKDAFPEDYTLYTDIYVEDGGAGNISLLYRPILDSWYRVDGNYIEDANEGEVVRIKGSKYVLTDTDTSDGEFEVGPAIVKAFSNTMIDPDSASVVTGTLKMLYNETGGNGRLYMYDVNTSNTSLDSPIITGKTYPYKLNSIEKNSTEYEPYDVYVVKVIGNNAYISMVDKSQKFNITNDDGGVLGYYKAKVYDSANFASTNDVYFMSAPVNLVKGDTIDMPGTYYSLDFTSANLFDILRKKPSIVASGTTLKSVTDPGKDFLATGARIVVSSIFNLDSRPDLTVSPTDISFSDSTPTQGKSVKIIAKARNSGEDPAGNFTLKFYVDGVLIGHAQASENQKVNVAWVPTYGTHEIKVVADEDNTINESNENNNDAAVNISVQAASIGIYYDTQGLHDDANENDGFDSLTLNTSHEDKVISMNAAAYLRRDGNADGDLKDDPEDYTIYTDVYVIDSANGDIQLAYNLTEDTTYSNGNGNMDEGEVVTIMGTNYVLTDNQTADGDIEIGPAITRTLPAVAPDEYNAVRVQGTLKILLSSTNNRLRFYDGGSLLGEVTLSGISTYPYRIKYSDINSSVTDPYRIYLISNTSTQAKVAFAEKSQLWEIHNNDTGAAGYGSVKIGDADFAGGVPGVYFLSDVISMAKGYTVDMPDTHYRLKYTTAKEFDILRRTTSTVESATTLKSTVAPGKHFLAAGPVTLSLNETLGIDIEFGSNDLHDNANADDEFGSLPLPGLGGDIINMNATAYLRYDANSDGGLEDPEDYTLYTDVYVLDDVSGDVQLLYRPILNSTYKIDGNYIEDAQPGEVLEIKGEDYVLTDTNTSDGDFEIGPAIVKTLSNTTQTADNATVVTGTLKMLFTNTKLVMYDGNSLLDSPVITGKANYPYKLTSDDKTSEEFAPYDVYVINASEGVNALVAMVEKSQKFKVSDGEEGVLGYPSVKVNNSEFAGNTGNVYFLDDAISMVKGTSVDVPDTLYQLWFSYAKVFDIHRKQTYSVVSGTELNTTAEPGSDFLISDITLTSFVALVQIPSPTIWITSPENKVYNTSSAPLSVSSSETINTWWYSINDGNYTLFTPPTTISGFGRKKIIVKGMDTTGNTHLSTTTYFTLAKSEENVVVNVTENIPTIIDLKEASKTMIIITPNTNGTLNVTVDTVTDAALLSLTDLTSTYGLAQNQKSLGLFFSYHEDNESEFGPRVTRWYYDYLDLDKNGDGTLGSGDINENALKMYWHCENCSGSQEWFPLTKGNSLVSKGGPEVYDMGINTAENYIWANISHFSNYSIGGDVIYVATTSTGGGEPPSIKVMSTLGRVEITIPKLMPFETTTVEIPEARNVEISNISINVNKVVYKAKITITTLSYGSEDREDPGGEVYHYNVVDLENIEDGDINNVTLGFKVRQTWLTNKNVNSNKVSMNRYRNGSWSKLKTARTSTDTEYFYYSALSPGF